MVKPGLYTNKRIPSTMLDRNIRIVTPPDQVLEIGQLQPEIDEVMKSILPQIESFLENPEIPKWNPSPFIKDPRILEFFRELGIPAYPNESPSLLYHNLHSRDDDYVIEKIFGIKKHMYWAILIFSFEIPPDRDSNGVGVKDLQEALDDIRCYKDWENDLRPFEEQIRYKISNSNIKISKRVIQKVLASRVVVFQSFLQLVIDRDGSLRPEHRQMWLLFQLSNCLPGLQTLHPFVRIKNCLNVASDEVLRALISGLDTIHATYFPKSEFIIALDEAQYAARLYQYSFVSSTSPNIFRSVLREIVTGFLRSSVKVIVSGTGLSLEQVEDVLSSSVGKPPGQFETFVELGMLDDPLKLDATLRQYIPPSFLESESGKFLQQRIREYLPGRYRFLISFVELLLANGLQLPHTLLNQYIEKYALCPPGDSGASKSFILKEDMVHIEPQGPEGIQEVAAIVQSHLTKGSTPTFGPLTQKLVEYGIARLRKNHENHHGEIMEPLAFLSIVKWLETQKDLCLEANLRCQLAHQHSRGYGFEELVILYLLRTFCDSTPLSSIFSFHDDKTHIVARLNGKEVRVDVLGNSPMNPALGVVDYVETIEEIIGWIEGSPTASTVLVTCHLFGPDMLVRGQNGIFFMCQAKSYLRGNQNELSADTIVRALHSLNPTHWFKQQPQLQRQRLMDTLQKYKILRFLAGYPLAANLNLEAQSVKTALSELGPVPLATLNVDMFRAKYISSELSLWIKSRDATLENEPPSEMGINAGHLSLY
ncbi:hypothetical protein BU17DRAFT_71445 [Hysterangium stoloniferum]|nr:hypothetical protein BU17DRAFT_71445 [Hysterangium stoloniferum]